LKGQEYKTERAKHETLRRKDKLSLARRNKYFGKWKQAEHDFEYLNKGRKITDKSSSIAK